MNFNEFKERYIAKLLKSGMYTKEELENDDTFNDRMAEMYLGFMVYSEYQNELSKAAYEAQLKAEKEAMNKTKIYVPNGGALQ